MRYRSASVSDQEQARLVAWSAELRGVHARLRGALKVTRDTLAEGAPGAEATRDLLLYCHGFCVALDGHHRGEDTKLFPAIEAAHPELSPVLRSLTRDHSMIAHLLSGLETAVKQSAPLGELERRLEGVGAIMENHFRYEERQLLSVLDALHLDESPAAVLGPI
jgi:hemerythrin-like domain-containing protein